MLMLAYLLPIRWQYHTVVSDHTVSNISPTTPNHTTIIHYQYPGRIGTTLYTSTLEWKPRACLDHPLHLAINNQTPTRQHTSKLSYNKHNMLTPTFRKEWGYTLYSKAGVEAPNLLGISLSSLEAIQSSTNILSNLGI